MRGLFKKFTHSRTFNFHFLVEAEKTKNTFRNVIFLYGCTFFYSTFQIELSVSFHSSFMYVAFFSTAALHISIWGKINVVLPFHKFNSNLRSRRFCCWKIKVFIDTTKSIQAFDVCVYIFLHLRMLPFMLEHMSCNEITESDKRPETIQIRILKHEKKIAEKYTLYINHVHQNMTKTRRKRNHQYPYNGKCKQNNSARNTFVPTIACRKNKKLSGIALSFALG